MASWQSALKDTSSIMHYLLETGTLSDVTFLVRNGSNKKLFYAHKLLLAVRSDIFERMFFGALPKKGGRIEISDISPHTFEIMLKFMYEDTLEVNSMDEAMDTFIAARKYKITQLMHLSSNYIKDHLNPKNVTLVYQISAIYDYLELKSVCRQVIIENPEEVIQSKGFTQIPFEMVESILDMKSLNISNHLLLFECLIRWAKTELKRHQDDEAALNLRQLMGPFLPRIKFLSMSSKEFTRGPAASGIFTESEVGKILMNISVPNSAHLPEWCKQGNNLKQGLAPSLPQSAVKVLPFHNCRVRQAFANAKFNIHLRHKIFFQCGVSCIMHVTGKDILLKAFSIFSYRGAFRSISFEINNTKQTVDITPCSSATNSEGVKKPREYGPAMKLMLKEPFLLKDNCICRVKVSASGCGYCNTNINHVDKRLPSGGRLLITYIPIDPNIQESLHFSHLFYSESI